MRKTCGSMAVALVLALGAVEAGAAVSANSAAGFVIKIEVPIAAPRADVHARALEIGRWWSDAHTYSGAAANMSLSREPGGCFCEKLDNGGFVRHGAVELSMPPSVLRFSGALGPLQELGAHGMLTMQFSAASEKETKLLVTYAVGGYEPAKGLGELAAIVDTVIAEQFMRLKRYAETGKPTG
jgi:hypothetical protein